MDPPQSTRDQRLLVIPSRVLQVGGGTIKENSDGLGCAESAHWAARQIMMPSMVSTMEQIIARMHIFFRDFCCEEEQDSYWEGLHRRAQRLLYTHLVVTGSLELLCSSFYMNFSILHICLNAVCREKEHRQ